MLGELLLKKLPMEKVNVAKITLGKADCLNFVT